MNGSALSDTPNVRYLVALYHTYDIQEYADKILHFVTLFKLGRGEDQVIFLEVSKGEAIVFNFIRREGVQNLDNGWASLPPPPPDTL